VSTSERFAAPWGVIINGAALAIGLVTTALSVPLAVDVATSPRVPAWVTVLLLGGAATFALAALWVLFRVVRWQVGGKLQRAHADGVEIRVPTSIHPHLVLITVGLAVFSVGAVWVVIDVATRAPVTVVRAIGVGAFALGIAMLPWFAWIADHLRQARLLADRQGIRWDRVFVPGSVSFRWEDVDRIRLRGRMPTSIRIEVLPREGRPRRLPIIVDPSIPVSSAVYRKLTADLDALRSRSIERG
jgi:hypothetical protein